MTYFNEMWKRFLNLVGVVDFGGTLRFQRVSFVFWWIFSSCSRRLEVWLVELCRYSCSSLGSNQGHLKYVSLRSCQSGPVSAGPPGNLQGCFSNCSYWRYMLLVQFLPWLFQCLIWKSPMPKPSSSLLLLLVWLCSCQSVCLKQPVCWAPLLSQVMASPLPRPCQVFEVLCSIKYF